MDISKIESGNMTLKKEKNIIHDLILELYNKFLKEGELKDKSHINLRKVIHDSGRNIILNSDKLRLTQVFNNIFQNAMKFTDQGFIEMGYSVKEYEVIEFYIKDSGIGIEENKKEIIFERFRMTDETMTRRFGGAGLGLSISKSIITMLNGEIRVESAVGKGSTFYFTIPVDSSDIMLNQNNGEYIEKPGSAGTDLSGKTILVVEDEDANYFLIETLLRKYNPKIIRARDGLDAIRVTQSQDNPDLILMDIRLPGLNGIESTRKIREFNPKVPIIAQTAYAFPEDKEKAIAAGCNDFITKPINHDQLIKKINKHISQKVQMDGSRGKKVSITSIKAFGNSPVCNYISPKDSGGKKMRIIFYLQINLIISNLRSYNYDKR
ncbi:MAG: response regulator [Bacteroidetes bacterium]|nr:response regulator [Bacteroidota bacterium]